jgi:hypothetical protein
MHIGNSFNYQNVNDDPIADIWTKGIDNDHSGMAAGPVSRLNGSLQIRAIGGGYTKTDVSAADALAGIQVMSRIELSPLLGTPPNYTPPQPVGTDQNGPIYNTILQHYGNESPWVFDPHYCYDDDTGKLWMTWGGHSGWVTEVDATTGKVVDPATKKVCTA